MSKPTPAVFETFGDPSQQIERFLTAKPSIFNGTVSVERYRITIERIEEPEAVLKERLTELIEAPGHIDKYKHVRKAAARLGIKLE